MKKHIVYRTLLIVSFLFLLFSGYVGSIVWRVSFAEQALFGRSDLLPLSLKPQQFKEPPTLESFGKETYTYVLRGRSIRVYEQLINSFQHVYGSALAASEIGNKPADFLFRANEYFEALCWRNSGSRNFYFDTKKDLANNAIGRRIGLMAKEQGLMGEACERFILDEIFRAIDEGAIYKDCAEPRVGQLPSLSEYGCPLLAKIQEARRLDKTLVFR
jgi:hypothetical protein